jgi:oxygen-dependent protoporphyrinogen oxidase
MLTQKESDIPSTASRRRLVVIGAGIAGLTAAYRLTRLTEDMKNPPEVLLLEAGPRPGGVISTYNLDDIILELGPDSFVTDKPAALNLVNELNLSSRLIKPNSQHRRTFVARDGNLHAVPDGFFMVAPTKLLPIMSSPLFSFQGKMDMIKEPLRKKSKSNTDESVRQFIERRLGREVYDRVAEPMVGAIYTGDTEKLSARSVIPRFVELEDKYGSIVSGLRRLRHNNIGSHESGARYSMFASLDDGLNVLVNELVRRLPEGSFRTHALVSKVKKGGNGHRFSIVFYDDSQLEADGVVVATSAGHAADMLDELDASIGSNLRSIPTTSSAVLNFIYRREDIPHPLDGFGFVVPRLEKRAIIACSFSSVKWPGRAPADKALMRIFVGGVLQKDVYDYSDEQIECLVWQDMNTYLGIKSLPLLSVISRFPQSMPQYNVGHQNLIATIDNSVAKISGLALAGNAYRGVGITDCIQTGEQAAASIVDSLAAIKE